MIRQGRSLVPNRMDSACEMPVRNATSEEVRRILETSKTVAVVALSDKPDRDSHRSSRNLAGTRSGNHATGPANDVADPGRCAKASPNPPTRN
jgi:hypothetical protein